MWRKRSQYRGEGSVAGYLRQIAYRTYLNARPRLERSRLQLTADGNSSSVSPDNALDVGARLDGGVLAERVRALVEALPEDWRVALVLFRFEGLSCSEIANLLHTTPKAVERRLTRALEAVTRRARATQSMPNQLPRPTR